MNLKFKVTKKIFFGKNRSKIIKLIIKLKSFRYIRELFYITNHPNELDLFEFQTKFPRPIIVDIGAFVGVSAKKYVYMYPNAELYLFEPVTKFFNELLGNFQENKNVVCFNKAITVDGRNVEIIIDGAASSTFLSTSESLLKESCESISVEQMLNLCGRKISLLQINCEGGEYAILNKLFELNLIDQIENINIQYHYLSPKNVFRRFRINKQLSKTHSKKWSTFFIWERWEVKTFQS
jgi:FkbM family methyltransferase